MISRALLEFVELMAESTDQEADEILEEASNGLSIPERRQLSQQYDSLTIYIKALRFDPTANFAVIAADYGSPSYTEMLQERYGDYDY